MLLKFPEGDGICEQANMEEVIRMVLGAQRALESIKNQISHVKLRLRLVRGLSAHWKKSSLFGCVVLGNLSKKIYLKSMGNIDRIDKKSNQKHKINQ